MKIYSWGFLGSQICVLSDDIDEAWNKACPLLIENGFGDSYTKDDANLIVIRNGMFCVYDIWEMQ